MAHTYPLALPTATGISEITWRFSESVAATESIFSEKVQVSDWLGKRLEANVKLPSMTEAQVREWQGFFLALNGLLGTFRIGPTLDKAQKGVATGTPLINGASQSGTTINTDGWTPDTTGILKAGDWIQIGDWLHMVTKDADSGATTGPATLEIWPQLRATPADNDPITLSNPKGLFRLLKIPNIHHNNNHVISPITFEIIEAI